jgi:N-acetylglucosaminyl-diphospho-decaprenol L-rhamnosyltransferase
LNAQAGIAAVVVTYQSNETIDSCLRRLRDAEGVMQIRVVDNGSADETLAIVQRHAAADPRLHFIANPDNPGFGVACNQGAADCDAPWLAFVNPDCFVAEDTLERLQAHAVALGGEALLGADLVDETGERDAAARRHDPDFGHMLRTGSPASVDSTSPIACMPRTWTCAGALATPARWWRWRTTCAWCTCAACPAAAGPGSWNGTSTAA